MPAFINCAHAECGKPLKPPILQCSKCHAVAYCSRDCQVKAWKAGHKRSCNAGRGDEAVTKAAAVEVNVARLPEITQALHDTRESVQEEAAREIRQLLSSKCPPIRQVMKAGVVPRFVEFLARSDRPTLQYEAAYALSNIASGASKFTHEVVDKGALPMLLQLLDSPNADVREQALWALGNIAGDSSVLRDRVLQHDVITPIMRNLDVTGGGMRLSLLRVTAWSLSNMCRGKPQPSAHLIKPALAALAALIRSSDHEVLADVCWSLSYLSDGDAAQIQPVVEAGVGKRLTELLMHEAMHVKKPALRAVGNIVTGDDPQTQYMINCGVLPCLHQLLSNDCKKTRQETSWILSNITCTGSKEQLQAVIDHDILPALIRMLANEDVDICHECAWAIYNATFIGSPQQIEYLVGAGCVPPLVELLASKDTRVVGVALESLENILKSGQAGANVYVTMVEACGGMERIKSLMRREGPKLHATAAAILGKYFGHAKTPPAPAPAPQPQLQQEGRGHTEAPVQAPMQTREGTQTQEGAQTQEGTQALSPRQAHGVAAPGDAGDGRPSSPSTASDASEASTTCSSPECVQAEGHGGSAAVRDMTVDDTCSAQRVGVGTGRGGGSRDGRGESRGGEGGGSMMLSGVAARGGGMEEERRAMSVGIGIGSEEVIDLTYCDADSDGGDVFAFGGFSVRWQDHSLEVLAPALKQRQRAV